MQIAHISDLHIGLSETRDEVLIRRLQKIRDLGVEHLIISGDLVQSAQRSEFQKVVQTLQNYGFYSEDKLSVVPGNHDLFSFFFRYFQSPRDFYRRIHKMPSVSRGVYKYGWRDYEKDLTFFNSFFEATFSNAIFPPESNLCGYPYIKLIEDNIALIGLDTNQLLPTVRKNPACSNGYLDPTSTREILSNKVLDNRIKIVVMHHYLCTSRAVSATEGRLFSMTMRLLNRTEILQIFDEFKVDLVLHGHYHRCEEYRLNGSLRILNSGDGAQWTLIEPDNGQIKVHQVS